MVKREDFSLNENEKEKKKSWKHNIKINILFGNTTFANIRAKTLVLKVIDDNK